MLDDHGRIAVWTPVQHATEPVYPQVSATFVVRQTPNEPSSVSREEFPVAKSTALSATSSGNSLRTLIRARKPKGAKDLVSGQKTKVVQMQQDQQ